MSEYATISIGKYAFLTERNDVRSLLYFFSPEEFVQTSKDEYQYITTVKKAKEILDATGYTLTRLERKFSEMLEIKEFEELFDEESKITKKNYTYKNWLKAIKNISIMLENEGYDYKKPIKGNNLIEKMILKTINYSDFTWNDTFWGIPNEYLKLNDDFLIFRAILESFNNDKQIVLDYTWIAKGGYCDANLPKEWFEIERTIIMTEGKFDAFVLESVIELLYPHLKNCFYFMDFDMTKVQR